MRTLSTIATEIFNRQSNVNLISIVKITWSVSDITYHSDKTLVTPVALDDLYELSEISYKKTFKKSIIVGTVTVVLCDTDKTYFNKLKTVSLFKKLVSIYQGAEGLAFSEYLAMFDGEIASPITYDEVRRTVTFEVIPPLKGKQIPFSPSEEGSTKADLNTQPDFYGAGFPTCFGKVVDVPCQLVDKGPEVFLSAAIDESANINVFVTTEPDDAANPFTNGSTPADFLINRERVTGYWGAGANNKRLTITVRNKALLSVGIGLRPSVGTDVDANLSIVLWLQAPVQIVGTWIEMTAGISGQTPFTGKYYNYCYKQIGTKCWFKFNWRTNQSTAAKLSGGTLRSTRYSPAAAIQWAHAQGTRVKRVGSGFKCYVVTDSPISAASSIVRVRAYRNIPIIGGPDGQLTTRQIVKVPDTYYEIKRNDGNYSHGSFGCTTITFDPPLSERYQGWEDDVFVSLTSDYTSGDERNPVRAIQYILTNYTDFTPDSTNFDAVAAQLSDFNSDFCLFKSRDALETCADIAWQARCALIILGRTVKLKYLSVPDPTYEGPELTNDLILLDPTVIPQSENEELVTVFTAKYQESYLGTEQHSIKRVNTTFGEYYEEFNFFIYQNKTLINKTRDFWANRYGNNWKFVQLQGVLPCYALEPMDFPQLNCKDISDPAFQMLGDTTIRCVIEEIAYQNDGTVTMKLWTPTKDGTNAKQIGGWGSVTAPAAIDPLANMSPLTTDDIAAEASDDV